jgi:hypothetical protein
MQVCVYKMGVYILGHVSGILPISFFLECWKILTISV